MCTHRMLDASLNLWWKWVSPNQVLDMFRSTTLTFKVESLEKTKKVVDVIKCGFRKFPDEWILFNFRTYFFLIFFF